MTNRSGFTMTELIIGVSLITLASLAIFTVGKSILLIDQKVKLVTKALEIEAAISSALLNEETFATHKSALSSSQTPTGLKIQNATGTTIATVGSSQKFDMNGTNCTGNNCIIEVFFDIKCSSATSCLAAYFIKLTAPNFLSVANFGQRSGGGSFLDADYFLPIPSDFYLRADRGQCDAPDDLFVSGFNRLSGALSCIKLGTRKCGANQIAKGLAIENGKLELQCVNLRNIKCDGNYVLHRFNPQSLDPEFGSGVSGDCVYFMKKRSAALTKSWPNSASVSDRFCPTEYKVIPSGSCTVVNNHRPGTCAYPCGADNSQTCYSTAYASPGSISFNHSGPNMSCNVSPSSTSGDCGSSWSGTVQWSGVCELTLPETKAAF